MSCRHSHCSPETVVDPVQTVYRDVYHPQQVTVVHPIEIVTRHHCVPVRCDVYKYICRDENVGGVESVSEEGHNHEGYDRSTISRKKSAKKSVKSRARSRK
ncbi:hypothetical protein NYE40_10450 [Paenibacillus sp. FSL W8-1187]|uniref:Inner spore coat protein D n=1 Tax=Paenibacillus pasadenensis TaxID=217090 RepID=A0A2N5N5D6_9BACL|nr:MULTISPECIES: hypothetical protein [Paenibacillus]PLT45566.1 hypothetical protein B8V81_3997 [Paenibacillus pasadenensis]QGG56026.1 hypothetical protein GE073_10875 [Paenibacillus sp. B01]